MGLLDFFLKTEEHKKLTELLWVEEVEGSVRELSLMAGMSYATAYEELHRMENMGLVKKRRKGNATLFSSSLSKDDKKLFAALANRSPKKGSQRLVVTRLQELGLPLVGDLSFLKNETADSNEELVVKAVCKAKENPYLARSLPVVLVKALEDVDPARLHYWSKKKNVKRELGFYIALTALLSKKQALKKLAKSFYDKRWSKSEYLLTADKGLGAFQAKLVESNTPSLAKLWKLKMNLGLDSFESLFNKFVSEGF